MNPIDWEFVVTLYQHNTGVQTAIPCRTIISTQNKKISNEHVYLTSFPPVRKLTTRETTEALHN